jgi:acetyl esterase
MLLRGLTRAVMSRPSVTLLGWRRRNGVDTALDRQVAAILELQRMLRLPRLESMEPAKARRFAEGGLSPLDVAPMPMAEIVDTSLRARDGFEIPARIYRPFDAGDDWIMYLHGGGGVIGSIRSSEPVTRLLAAQTRCTVASIEYRLGPEAKHPTAIHDAVDAWTQIVARAPANARIAVAGDSFGGFLSAQVDHAAKRRPDLQVLIYPIVDLTLTSPSIERHADGYLLTKSMMHWFRSNYMHDTDDRRAPSPKYWPDLRGSAPAIVVTAGYDPLVDEGGAYAQALHDAGVTVRHRHHPSLIHGFLSLAGAVRAARDATDQICDDIRELLAAPAAAASAAR